jgi:hypothetical protein
VFVPWQTPQLSVAVLAALLAASLKGWTNLELARSRYPVRYETGFGTVAGTTGSREIFEQLRAAMGQVPADRRTLFSYPSDASLYLTVPGENPTPFSLLMPQYNTPEQFQTVFKALGDRRADYVIVGMLFVKPDDDPLVQFLEGRYVRRAAVGLYAIYVPGEPTERMDSG